ncbi:MAG: homoserine dehydrogenase [Candidatus Brocadia sp. AMX2]|uniref:Homoserine dehydrogenase n=1 Tax=Candidatus Brocadia sinica JPN1 TaxID=1197129 RepID=A0ABQ0JV06_9BACT|nr:MULTISPECIES: homoserine dehydrogenase [Brocadia]KXK32886.1 MAG: homoserine dehydrogenase [Candidatus Brocadia sinica]MBC6933823.1 homoserine dehydrogenase [Candidatus Brocadia sp.]MBL1167844.1 homoserine dehydrogenase [Candidatus Brocadia sp. AMX1]NOG41591.1 homoserine dehydrogenase [Planctomycetota bacterium]KAA0241555.1 MAG: homoserine dehydrogenase [Candidatus Brocadia sp. AMX2]
MNTFNVGLIGMGTVGAGVAKILLEKGSPLLEKLDCVPVLKGIADRNPDVKNKLNLPSDILFTTDAKELLNNPDIQVVVELIGGLHPAMEIITTALEKGKDVVTANKMLLALHGSELFSKARRHGKSISFEASVGGGIPIIAALRDGFIANKIEAIFGIVNGTTNYILTKMTREKVKYSDALAEAQRLGYAEKDPTMDVEGIDSSHKLAILARIGFGVDFDYKNIYHEGISAMDLSDIWYAHELGYTLKLLAIAKKTENNIELRVHPTLLPHDHPLSSVNGVFNAICITGSAVGETMLYGKGAGQMPTASAVVADLVDVALGRAGITFKAMKTFSGHCEYVPIADIQQFKTRYYLRFSVVDKPGVLAKISGILGKYEISIASVIQHKARENGTVPLVMMTHLAEEGNLQKALTEMKQLDVIKDHTKFLRVEE